MTSISFCLFVFESYYFGFCIYRTYALLYVIYTGYTIHVCMYVYLFKVIMKTFRNKILYLTLLLIFSLSLSFSLSLESKRNFLVKV